MGLGWHVVLEREIPEATSSSVGGKNLVFYQHELAALAGKLRLLPLTDYLCADPQQVADYLQQQGLDPKEFPVPEVEWHDPADGLATIRGLLEHLRESPRSVPNAERVIRELQTLETALVLAEREHVSFHLSSTLPNFEG